MENQTEVINTINKKEVLGGVKMSLLALVISLPLSQFAPSILYAIPGVNGFIMNSFTSGNFLIPIILIVSGMFLVVNTVMIFIVKGKSKKIGVLFGYLFSIIPLIILAISVMIGG